MTAIDTIIDALRTTDGEPHDNRSLARALWLIGLLIGALAAVYGYTEWLYAPDAGASVAAVVGDFLYALALTATAIVCLGSLVLPTRRIELWLDDRYPAHAAGETEYGFYDDVRTTALLTAYWGTHFVVVGMVASIGFQLVSLASEIQEAGVSLDRATLTEMTVLNSVALATLALLLGAWGIFRAVKWALEDSIEEFDSPESNALDFHGHREGGATDGA